MKSDEANACDQRQNEPYTYSIQDDRAYISIQPSLLLHRRMPVPGGAGAGQGEADRGKVGGVMSVRDEIADRLIQYQQECGRLPADVYLRVTNGTADAILALIRERMLSREVEDAMRMERVKRPIIDAMVFGVAGEVSERDLMVAALDAALGKDDDHAG